jgi:hypothetical protein
MIGTHDTVKKGWSDGSSRYQVSALPPGKGTRLVILHCGSSDGWDHNGLKLCGKKNGGLYLMSTTTRTWNLIFLKNGLSSL